jgi:uncharacterized protein (TIGR02145 family)
MMIKNLNHFSFLTLLAIALFLFPACDGDDYKELKLAEVFTMEPLQVTDSSAIIPIAFSPDGLLKVIESGVCWGTVNNPTLVDNISKKLISDGWGGYLISGLTAYSKYYARCYVVTDAGIGYGNTVVINTCGFVKDKEGKKYLSDKYGTKEWMKQNIRTTTYNNGEAVMYVPESPDWKVMNTGAYSLHNGTADSAEFYGHYYNWYVANDTRNICPEGWHVPGIEEWNELIGFFSNNNEAVRMAEFCSRLGGLRNAAGSFQSYVKGWWTSSQASENGSVFIQVNDVLSSSINDERTGFPIRCAKD